MAFRTHSMVPKDVEAWADLVPESHQLPVFRFDSVNLKLANLRAFVATLNNSPNKNKNSYTQQILREAAEVDQLFYNWANTLPESWFPVRITRDQRISPSLQLYQEHCDVYKSLFLASTWNKLRLSQIEVQSIIVNCLNQEPATPSNLARLEMSEQNIQQLADDICASVPFCLGDRMKPGRTGDPGVKYPRVPGRPSVMDHYQTGPAMGGWALLQPLGQLMKMKITLREGQKGWLAGQIARTARIYNIAMPKG